MRILLVEDDEMLGRATQKGLRSAYAVDWVMTAADAEASVTTASYDLIVLDIQLPDRSGIEILQQMRREGRSEPVLFLTARDALSQRIAGLDAGADDYLVKPFDLHELLSRAAAIIRRSQGRASPLLECGDIVFDPLAKVVRKEGKPVTLSSKELRILEILMTRRGRVVSRAEIEENIYDWDSGQNIGSNTVEVHIMNLRKKLGRDFIKTSRGLGYVVSA